MAVRNNFAAGEVLAAADLNDTFASKLNIAGDKVVQIKRAEDSTQRTTTSTSFVDVTGMSVTISPTKTDSAVLLIASFNWEVRKSDDLVNFARLAVTDSLNNIISGTQPVVGLNNYTGSTTRTAYGYSSLFAFATPATTSATTYKLRFRCETASQTFILRNNESPGRMLAIEVSA